MSAEPTSAPVVCAHGGDLSESVPTLHAAAAVAAAFAAPLLVVVGYDPPLIGGEVGDLRRAAGDLAQQLLDEAVAEIARVAPDVTVEPILVEDRPTESVLFVAEQRGARMIVVGHGGEGPVRGALLGSVTYNLVHRSPVPVLVVPSPDAD